MPRTLLIQVKVDEAEKAQIAEVAERAGMAPSAYLRHIGLSEHRLQNKPDFDKDRLAKSDKRIEDDLAAKDAFLSKRVPELKTRMSSRRAEAQARKEWDEGESF